MFLYQEPAKDCLWLETLIFCVPRAIYGSTLLIQWKKETALEEALYYSVETIQLIVQASAKIQILTKLQMVVVVYLVVLFWIAHTSVDKYVTSPILNTSYTSVYSRALRNAAKDMIVSESAFKIAEIVR